MKNWTGISFIILLLSCSNFKKRADFILHNARIYTLDKNFSIANSLVVKEGKILAIGDYDTLKNQFDPENILDGEGNSVFPGFIDAHAHFYSFGQNLRKVKLVGTKSWDEILDSVKTYSKRVPEGWILGAGWDQNHWALKEFPNKNRLDSLFPNRPIALTRIDGHAIIANQAALNLAGIYPGQVISGGLIETQKGKLTGVLVDNATSFIKKAIPKDNLYQIQESLLKAQSQCFSVGLTTVDECGVSYSLIKPIQDLQNSGELKMKIYIMLSDAPENYNYLFQRGKIKTPALNVQSFKVYADGALGSRGACLLKPYSDKPNETGFLLNTPEHYLEVAQKIYTHGFQMNTHAIGDSANRTLLKIYSQVLKGRNDRRWRIEHAQIVSSDDLHYFGDFSIIPSVQPTHATSDMFWAVERLGPERIHTGYAYKQLLDQNGWIPLGTDFPVENINPLYTFYAAVIRKDLGGKPESGFQMENALTRKEALQGMTIWAAKANFEEKEKGSLEPGKMADWVILDQDIMTIPGKEIPQVKVLKTFLNGKMVFNRKLIRY
jgi:predicted amidohydrolase YtcJ